MSVLVTLDVYSGRPNPSWELTNKESKSLISKIKKNKNQSFLKSPISQMGLGYRGFRIDTIGEESLPERAYLNANLLDLGQEIPSQIFKENDLEKWLLETGKDNIDKDLIKDVKKMIKNPMNDILELIKQPRFNPGVMLAQPVYNPGWWNNNRTRLLRNNCYNYANNKATNTFAQPGRGSGRIFTSLTCRNVGDASVRDGLRRITNPNQTPAQGHFVYLAIWPGRDYHWWRRDSNNRWSHKPGSTPVRNVDNSGNLITNPVNCDRGPYTTSCGYLHTIPSRIRIN